MSRGRAPVQAPAVRARGRHRADAAAHGGLARADDGARPRRFLRHRARRALRAGPARRAFELVAVRRQHDRPGAATRRPGPSKSTRARSSNDGWIIEAIGVGTEPTTVTLDDVEVAKGTPSESGGAAWSWDPAVAGHPDRAGSGGVLGGPGGSLSATDERARPARRPRAARRAATSTPSSCARSAERRRTVSRHSGEIEHPVGAEVGEAEQRRAGDAPPPWASTDSTGDLRVAGLAHDVDPELLEDQLVALVGRALPAQPDHDRLALLDRPQWAPGGELRSLEQQPPRLLDGQVDDEAATTHVSAAAASSRRSAPRPR